MNFCACHRQDKFQKAVSVYSQQAEAPVPEEEQVQKEVISGVTARITRAFVAKDDFTTRMHTLPKVLGVGELYYHEWPDGSSQDRGAFAAFIFVSNGLFSEARHLHYYSHFCALAKVQLGARFMFSSTVGDEIRTLLALQ